jgi:hypothetical protein
MPWHYTSVWIGMTTPPLYLFLFLIGMIASLTALVKRHIKIFTDAELRQDTLFLAWFIGPMVAVIILNSVLYDGYRHMFFVYPALIIIAMRGFVVIRKVIQRRLNIRIQTIAAFVLALIFAASMIKTLWFMVQVHPFQNVYFNRFAGKDMVSIKTKFELDYWGLSYRRALEYILENDPDDQVPVYPAQLAGNFTRDIIHPRDRHRIKYVQNPDEARYFISNYRWHQKEYPYEKEFFSIKVRGARIIVVYKFEENSKDEPAEST